MPIPGWIAGGLCLVIGAWLAFDGSRALIVGDYVTPKSGQHAGQLGPWSAVFRSRGIDPRSTPIKLLHVVVGVMLCASVILLLLHPRLGWRCLLAASICGLWYVPFGTLTLLVAIVLLALPSMRTSVLS